MNPKLTAEEARTLRREVRGIGNLVRLGLIAVTDKGREWISQDDERVRAERIAGGKLGKPYGVRGKKYGKRGGRPPVQ